MDVGFYLGELLMQQGEVSVPGLGYFVQVRVSGYYNDAERKFYPPYHQAQFDVQSIDDDTLAEYIANKKNISITSSRYFCEKYITNLKQQAAIHEVQIGNLGWFYTELSQLTFKPAEKIADDTIFFGFEPISISKTSDAKPSTAERPKVELKFPNRKPDAETPTHAPNTAEPEIITTAMASFETGATTPVEETQTLQHEIVGDYQVTEPGISQEFFEPVEEEEEESRGPLRLILVILIIIVFAGLGVFALYRYKPDTFAKIAFWKKNTNTTQSVKPNQEITSKIDTAKAADTTQFIDEGPAKIDTIDATPSSVKKTDVITEQPATTKTTATQLPKAKEPSKVVTAQPAEVATAKTSSTAIRSSDATGTRRFEVYVSPDCDDMAQASRMITKLKNKGLDARIITDAAGPKIHISIGHFKTAAEAKAFAVKAQESGKVTGDAYPLEIIPQ